MMYIGFIFVTVGFGFIFSGIIGLLRFPGFYAKIHASSVIDSCGIPFCLTGLSFMQENFNSSFKLMLIVILIFLLNPLSTHSLAKASLFYKRNKIN